MERISPNLYRFTDEPVRKGRKYSYLIVRKQGNLLLPGLGPSIRDHFGDIEELGGVHTQFLTHVHDLNADLHEEIHARFGARLCYHRAARKLVREATECPETEFSNDGLQLDADFEALYFPFHTPGHSIFRWRYRGKHFLFTDHVVNLVNGIWELWFNPKAPQLRDERESLVRVDYALPTRSPYGQEELHRFNDHTRSTFAAAIDAAWVNPNPYARIVLKQAKPAKPARK